MEVTPFPIDTELSPLQSAKALSPMDVTLFGMLTEVKLLQSEKI